MSITRKIQSWGDLHHPKILDIIRMLLGIFLVVKGYIFLNNTGYLRYLIITNEAINKPPQVIAFIIFYVSYMHLRGGLLIFLGLYTRLWAILQLPIVFGAVFLVNILSPFVNSELWLSILVLALLCLFVVVGSGPLSIDGLLLKTKSVTEER